MNYLLSLTTKSIPFPVRRAHDRDADLPTLGLHRGLRAARQHHSHRGEAAVVYHDPVRKRSRQEFRDHCAVGRSAERCELDGLR